MEISSLAAFLETRSHTLFVAGVQKDDGIEFYLRDKTQPDFKDNDLGKPSEGGVVATGPSFDEMEKLKYRIMAGEVLKMIEEETK